MRNEGYGKERKSQNDQDGAMGVAGVKCEELRLFRQPAVSSSKLEATTLCNHTPFVAHLLHTSAKAAAREVPVAPGGCTLCRRYS